MLVVCDVYVFPCISFLFLLMIYILYSHCSYMPRIIFLYHYHLYHHRHHNFHFIFILFWIRAAWSTPTHWLLWVSRRVSVNHFFWKLFFGDHRWGVYTHFHICHMTSFNYDAKEVRDVGLSSGCHLSDSQIASSV